jgi:hypothetical protein
MARCRRHLQWPEGRNLAQPYVHRSTSRGDRRAREALADVRNRFGVIGVVVSQRHPPESSSGPNFHRQRFEVLLEPRPGIDQPGRGTADEP